MNPTELETRAQALFAHEAYAQNLVPLPGDKTACPLLLFTQQLCSGPVKTVFVEHWLLPLLREWQPIEVFLLGQWAYKQAFKLDGRWGNTIQHLEHTALPRFTPYSIRAKAMNGRTGQTTKNSCCYNPQRHAGKQACLFGIH